jgi:hypothetical protein
MTLTPQEDLRYACEDIHAAVAAGMDSFRSFGNKLSELLPGIVRAFQNADRLGSYEAVETFNLDQRAFIELVSKHSYIELREIKGYVPQGYHATFLEGLTVLGDAVERCTRLQAQVLKPYLTYLAPLLSSSDALKRPDDQVEFFSRLNTERTEMYARQKALYAQRTDTRAKIGQLLERNADWVPVFSALNKVTATLDSIKRDEIDLHVKHIEDYLKIIEGRLKENKIPEVSPEVSQALADGAYQIACELEYFGMVYYWVLGLKSAITDTVMEVTSTVK